jgi:outer membrane lipoprotein-sorting protein
VNVRRLTLLLALCLGLFAARASADAAPLDQLLAKLAKVEGLSAQFQEEKRMSLVAVPLKSEGTLYYQKPRALARHTLKPSRSSVLLSGDVVQFGDGKHSQSIALESQPAVRLLVDTFVSVLAGDKAALLRLASVSYEQPSKDSWLIRVVPKDPKLLRIVKAMTFAGKAAELSSMELVDGHGDVTRTTFTQIRFGKLPPAQAKSVLRIGG